MKVKMQKDQELTPQQRQTVIGLRRTSWFLGLFSFFICFVVYMHKTHQYFDQVIVETVVIATFTGVPVFVLIRMSIWVLKGFWKQS